LKAASALITKFQTTIYASTRCITGTGRHQAPSKINKTYVRAGAVALAVAAVGGIAAIPLTSSLASAAPSASIRQAASQDRSSRAGHSRSAKTSSGTGRHGSTSATSHGARSAHSPGKSPVQVKARPASKPKVAAMRCTGTSGMLPQNYATIVIFLTTHGYTKMAAAGIAGNIYQESVGNPESVGTGGGGLIGWTPLPPGFVTGNPAADLHTQLEALLTYNQQWAQYIPALNAATSPTQAADIYMNYFERPGIPAAYNRESAAAAVASACGF
jgi:hypothetical protein